jgi:hypothetical protein
MQQGDMRGMQPNMPGAIIQQQQQFMPQGQQVGESRECSFSLGNIVTSVADLASFKDSMKILAGMAQGRGLNRELIMKRLYQGHLHPKHVSAENRTKPSPVGGVQSKNEPFVNSNRNIYEPATPSIFFYF